MVFCCRPTHALLLLLKWRLDDSTHVLCCFVETIDLREAVHSLLSFAYERLLLKHPRLHLL